MREKTRVFIDTEFTDFARRDLISLGMVAETGEQFYGENTEYEKSWASQFVKDNVLSLCNFSKFGMKRERLAGKAWEWLLELPCKEITLMIDYGGDNELLDELFSNQPHPKITNVQNIFVPFLVEINTRPGSLEEGHKLYEACRNSYKIEFHNYFKQTKEIQHHALSDAKANLRGFNAMLNTLGLTY